MDSSETESYSSDKIANNTQDTTLDELLSQLLEELHKDLTTHSKNDDFKSIEASIKKLPKLESNFGKAPNTETRKDYKVARIHDPVSSAAASATSKNKQGETSGTNGSTCHVPTYTLYQA